MKNARLQIARAKASSWVTMIIVLPVFPRSCMTVSTSPTIVGSRALVGSSSRITAGFIDSVAAKRLHVNWFGGEPLLAPDVIEALSRLLIRMAEEKHAEYTGSEVADERGRQVDLLAGDIEKEMWIQRVLRTGALNNRGSCCGAHVLTGFSIDDKGNLYKCWNELDKPELSFGTAAEWDVTRPIESDASSLVRDFKRSFISFSAMDISLNAALSISYDGHRLSAAPRLKASIPHRRSGSLRITS